MSFIRHLLSLIGGFLLMRGVTDSSTIEIGTGVILGIAALVWSIKEKTATVDMAAGVLRQVMSFTGGFLMKWLSLSTAEWQFWVTALISLVPYFFKQSNRVI